VVTVPEPAAAPSVTAARCSAGITTTGGMITPGHCTAGTPNWSVGGGEQYGVSPI
jgi:hypothetical protein